MENKKIKLKRIESISEVRGYEVISVPEQMGAKAGGDVWGEIVGFFVGLFSSSGSSDSGSTNNGNSNGSQYTIGYNSVNQYISKSDSTSTSGSFIFYGFQADSAMINGNMYYNLSSDSIKIGN